MKKIFSVYGIAYLALLVFVFGLQYVYPKLELHLLLNSYHTSLQDVFFKYYTMLAEWPLYVLALLPIFWGKIKMTLFFAMCEISGGAILQLLKHTISTERPVSAFEHYHGVVLPLVQGVDMHHSNSFPSGHASTFFVFCTCCAIILAYHYKLKVEQSSISGNQGTGSDVSCAGNQNGKKSFNCVGLYAVLLLLLILAALGAYSRIYLSQHFLSDVCMGSIIGFLTPCLIFYFGRDKLLKLQNKKG